MTDKVNRAPEPLTDESRLILIDILESVRLYGFRSMLRGYAQSTNAIEDEHNDDCLASAMAKYGHDPNMTVREEYSKCFYGGALP